MRQNKVEQESLNTSQKYLFSITQKEEMEEDCAIYDVCIYQRRIKRGISNFAFPENVGEFEVAYMGDWDLFFINLKVGIEKRISTSGLTDWAKRK